MDKKYAKIQELLFELKVEDVMLKNVSTCSPDTTMSELRQMLRNRRISGAPVVEEKKLVGIISVEDLIDWLSRGGEDCAIREKMTRETVTLLADQSVAKAIEKFDTTGYGRFPVLDRDSRDLVGMITKGVIIHGVLLKLENEYEAEEIEHYRASHFVQDIVADHWEITLSYDIRPKDFNRAGKASTRMKKNLKRLGVHPDVVRRLAIASYEAEMNVVIYADGGDMTFRLNANQVTLRVLDQGPGIADIEKALENGYSTAENWVREMGFGAGMGLPNIARCADEMKLESTPGIGTCLEISINIPKNEEEPEKK